MRIFAWAACGTGFTFLMTVLGAALVFLMRAHISARMNRLCLGFAGGVMSAAAVFSLILPAIEQAPAGAAWAVATAGFGAGAGLMMALDALLSRRMRCADGLDDKRTLLFAAVTLHNIPEGMAVGLAFALAVQGDAAAWAGACALALGIGIQNFPEGAAISLPLRQSGMSRSRSFGYGALSGVVEPIFGIAAALTAGLVSPVMPWLMTLAAGAMMWVVAAEMMPEASAQRDGALAAMVGYMVMMALDVALG